MRITHDQAVCNVVKNGKHVALSDQYRRQPRFCEHSKDLSPAERVNWVIQVAKKQRCGKVTYSCLEKLVASFTIFLCQVAILHG
ncbi:hypothetical protein HBI56_151210 [Parastagonospora nodorum]|uniref:Uncharacterized protein n=1 Tax=Phaeosphaeria nodorum (strain SN15 / ATCC MYA-4574 / FGSC 10173) TaxID=321614 RepID=Q0U5T4_PHANO|nr:hypothetical protein SNOG_12880 [Parastagonospora nodorum SN15]KAH3907952.1 hypothetical protein HBH56_183310 [Parastagonospora nodorum]EAT79680.1 hypothetical protein SNOG_12880 [Parastagonospora nodorum SN15]KAH3925957.1 hypothetical protein HBH54_172460 [Parastagonospora nodorum]KAH3944946.1 hypothetical protein HBH53_152460 [Parastagonospora nodorum]KAH3962432.1 hypothetical protein HBH52_223960 [Parastagonospora nodorum]